MKSCRCTQKTNRQKEEANNKIYKKSLLAEKIELLMNSIYHYPIDNNFY